MEDLERADHREDDGEWVSGIGFLVDFCLGESFVDVFFFFNCLLIFLLVGYH